MAAVKTILFEIHDILENDSKVRGLCADTYDILTGDYGEDARLELCLAILNITYDEGGNNGN